MLKHSLICFVTDEKGAIEFLRYDEHNSISNCKLALKHWERELGLHPNDDVELPMLHAEKQYEFTDLTQ